MLLALIGASCSRHDPFNVVLISIDTLRADRMSLYGAERKTTPAIDDLARKSAYFELALSPAPWTLPGHAAMLTGRYPRAIATDFDGPVFELAPTLSGFLREAGYRTGAVTGGAFLSPEYGADQGFDSFEIGTAADATAWLDGQGDRPFFLFFHTYVTHIPYRDRRFVSGLEGGRLQEIYRLRPPLWRPLHLDLTCARLDLTEKEKEFLLALYDGGVAAADEMVAALVAKLSEKGLLDRTIVIVTSDHGEEFWDHTGRAAYHGHTLYGELLRVPMIWFEPGIADAGGARTEPVSLVDLVPTLLARLRRERPASLDGEDLSPLLDRSGRIRERLLFAEAVRHGPERLAVMSGDGKMILTSKPDVQEGEGERCAVPVVAEVELYLADDPAERANRYGAHPLLTEELTVALRRHHSESSRRAKAPGRVTLDGATEERLRALGYL